jgi:phenylpyruvate tautomerase PptA (4-oxalocrotonate tautomerase family)
MPLVKIDIAAGESDTFLATLLETTLLSVQQGLGLGTNERNIRLVQHPHNLFSLSEPYRIIVEIDLFSGRSVDVKRELYRRLTQNLEAKLDIAPKELFIFLNEQPRENWGIRGGIAACDIDFSK